MEATAEIPKEVKMILNKEQFLSAMLELGLQQGDPIIITESGMKHDRISAIFEKMTDYGVLIVSNPSDRTILKTYGSASIVSIEKRPKAIQK